MIDRLNTALAGRYRIERELGQGGMATVYLCDDLKHDRKVALKVLKPELAAVLGAERFVVEIKTTAALQHPHILPLFDSGAADGFLFYVMPFIDGETLRAKLDRETQLGVDESVRIAREVLDALHYAHEHGIVHRDVKPENILLHGGHAMVADFGIALAVSAAAGGRMTETGLSLGTPHYMSPEQATAEKDISARSDVYSLGSVLYEMLAGQPPHLGGSAQQIIMKIITETAPSVTTLRKSVPLHVAGALEKALEKLPADRFENAKAFADALENPHFTRAHGHGSVMARAEKSSVRALPWAVASIAVAAAVFVTVRRPAAAPERELRLGINTPVAEPERSVAISPDGRVVAYIGVTDGIRHVYRRALDNAEVVALPETEGANAVAFSPDGRWLVFTSGEKDVRKVPVEGGMSTALTNGTVPVGLAWSPRFGVVLGMQRLSGRYNGLTLISAAHDTGVRIVTQYDRSLGFVMDHFPYVLEDGETVLFSHLTGRRTQLGVVSLASGAPELVDFDLSRVVGVTNGVMLYLDNVGDLMAVTFDARNHRPVGPSVRVGDAAGKISQAAVSFDGTLVVERKESAYQVVLLDEHGQGQPLFPDTLKVFRPRFAPDGRRIGLIADLRRAHGTWMFDIGSRSLTKLPGPGGNWLDWTADSRRIVRFGSRVAGDRSAEFSWQSADGADSAVAFAHANGNIASASLAPDQRAVVFQTRFDVKVRPLTGDTVEVPFAATAAIELTPRFSPDGKWIAYASDESGRMEVYVRAYPMRGARVLVSDGGGNEPVWAKDGTRLFYRNGRAVMVADLSGGEALAVKQRAQLFTGDFRASSTFEQASWDVAPDGRHFVLARPVNGAAAQLEVWTGWLPNLKQRLAAAASK